MTQIKTGGYEDPIKAIEYALEKLDDSMDSVAFLQDWREGVYDDDYKHYVDGTLPATESE